MVVKLSNNATSTLSAAITANATAVTVQATDASLFPALASGEWFPATLVNATGVMEIVRVTARNGATMTIQRGQEGTTAKDFPVGSKLDLRLTAGALLDLPKPTIEDVAGLQEAIAKKLDNSGGAISGVLVVESKPGAAAIADRTGTSGGETGVSIRGNGGPALMTFHRPGLYAGYFGLDSDNQWKVGGWSMGGNSYTVWHAGNFNPDAAAPAGAVMSFARNTAPAGWLKANGAAISRTTYAKLFAAIGTTFGVGDGSTTFNLPDLRGEFIRAWDDGRGVDSGRVFGANQGSANASHNHRVSGSTAGAGSHSHSTTVWRSNGSNAGDGNFGARTDSDTAWTARTDAVGDHAHSFDVWSEASGENEARPRNIALLVCIKY